MPLLGMSTTEAQAAALPQLMPSEAALRTAAAADVEPPAAAINLEVLSSYYLLAIYASSSYVLTYYTALRSASR